MTAKIDTKALRALEANATPAPWAAWEKEHTRGDVVIGITWSVVCNHYTDETPAVFGDDGFWPITEDDAEFVSALRNAAPALLDAAEERDKYRTAANVLCAAHIGLPQASCPVCERDALRAELSWIDSVLARRPALDKPTRAANIERAINVAKQADALKAEVAKLQLSASDVEFHGNEQIKALRSEVERLREALANLLDYYQDSSENDAIAKARAALRSAKGEVQS